MDIRIDYEPLGYEDGAPYHTVQEDFWDSEAFSPAFLAARGAGKTMAGAAKNLKNMLLHGSNSLVVGPRYESQVRAVLVPTYLEVIPKELLFQPYHETHKSLLLCDLHALARNKREPGQTIWFRSGDEPETVEGFTVGTVNLDESARMDKAGYGLALGCSSDSKGADQIITTH